MPRPSRNLDQALLAAGRALLPHRGCAGLSIREVADTAGVNLGMFHYHFKSREAFLRALLQSMYEDMFAQLTQQASLVRPDAGEGAVDVLRAALRFMGRFLRANRQILARVMADALCGDPIASEFLARNLPRHLGLLQSLIQAGQAQGRIKAIPVPQALGFCAGSLAMPILFGGAVADSGLLNKAASKAMADALTSDAALDQRIELALGAITQPQLAPQAARPKKTRRGTP